MWEHEPLLATDTFQSQIPRPGECQVMVCILWSRIGTRLPRQISRPDGTPYDSGTEYEFENAVAGFHRTGEPALLVYRKTAEPNVSLRDEQALLQRLDQKRRLDGFLNRWFHDETDGTLKAAFHPFETSAQFEELLEAHLRKLLARRLPPITRRRTAARAGGGPGAAAAGPGEAPRPAWAAGSPFRGLHLFEFEHAPVFFGRSRAVGELLAALRRQADDGRAFVLVLGASGSGKSSLVRAGLLPLLTQPGVIEGVRVGAAAPFARATPPGPAATRSTPWRRPCSDPRLCRNSRPTAPPRQRGRHPAARQPIQPYLLIKGALAHAAAAAAAARFAAASAPPAGASAAPPESRLVLVADQLEELFTLDLVTPAMRQAFVAALASLARSGRVWVVATVRSDFYSRLAELPALVALEGGRRAARRAPADGRRGRTDDPRARAGRGVAVRGGPPHGRTLGRLAPRRCGAQRRKPAAAGVRASRSFTSGARRTGS